MTKTLGAILAALVALAGYLPTLPLDDEYRAFLGVLVAVAIVGLTVYVKGEPQE